MRVTVRGECMMPGIQPGSQVTVIPARRYWPGDVVAYRLESGELVLHRVLGYRRWRGAWCLLTRGDRGGGVDAPVPVERVIGRLRGRTPLIRRLAAVGRLLVLVPAVLVQRARR